MIVPERILTGSNQKIKTCKSNVSDEKVKYKNKRILKCKWKLESQ